MNKFQTINKNIRTQTVTHARKIQGRPYVYMYTIEFRL